MILVLGQLVKTRWQSSNVRHKGIWPGGLQKVVVLEGLPEGFLDVGFPAAAQSQPFMARAMRPASCATAVEPLLEIESSKTIHVAAPANGPPPCGVTARSRIRSSPGSGPTSITLTTAWQRFKITATLAAGQAGLWIVLRQFAGNGDNWTSACTLC